MLRSGSEAITTPVPTDHPYAASMWLLSRHPEIVELLARIPGAIDDERERPDLDVLAAAVIELDTDSTARTAYEQSHHLSGDEAAHDTGRLRPPLTTPGAEALARMSRTEQVRLRLLAVFSGEPIAIRVTDFAGMDTVGQAYMADWCAAIQAT